MEIFFINISFNVTKTGKHYNNHCGTLLPVRVVKNVTNRIFRLIQKENF